MIQIDNQELIDRFLRYVAVETTANPDTDDYPSSAGQLKLGQQLVAELNAMGIADAYQNDKGLVYATVPATDGNRADGNRADGNRADGNTVIAWNSHVDTSPEASGANIKPQLIESYTYLNMKLNVGLTDADFNHENANYNF